MYSHVCIIEKRNMTHKALWLLQELLSIGNVAFNKNSPWLHHLVQWLWEGIVNSLIPSNIFLIISLVMEEMNILLLIQKNNPLTFLLPLYASWPSFRTFTLFNGFHRKLLINVDSNGYMEIESEDLWGSNYALQ